MAQQVVPGRKSSVADSRQPCTADRQWCVCCFVCLSRGGLSRLIAWHLPVGQVGPPGRWAATSNVGGSGTGKGNLARKRGLYLDKPFAGATARLRPVCLLSQGRFEEPVRPCACLSVCPLVRLSVCLSYGLCCVK